MKEIDLVNDTIDNKDIDRLIDWLKGYPRLTKGPVTVEYEKKWSEWLGCKYSVFVNSGSSANLLMLYALKISENLKNKKICVPTLCWATDLSPVIQLGLDPILIDCNLQDLSVDIDHLELIFEKERPSVLLLVSVLGFSPDMDRIVSLCNKYEVILLEDNCESQGTEYKGTKLGNFGLMSSFSTYFGHTMSTIEGGMVCTNDKEMYNSLLQLRSHGWDRDLSPEEQKKLRDYYEVDDFDALYTFYSPGFNLRSTDLQAYIGIGQLDKVDHSIECRSDNYEMYRSILEPHVWVPKDIVDSYTANFAIPIISNTIQKKKSLISDLKKAGVACRPLIAGSMGTQPFYRNLYSKYKLPNASVVDNLGIYVPNHPALTIGEIKKICSIIIKNK